MLCDISEEIKEISENDVDNNLHEDKSGTTPEKGRVWRWRNNANGLRKNTEGPVLRATVKPVKRFIPEINSASATTSLSNQSVVGSKQNSAASTDDQTTTSDVKSKRQPSSNTSSQNVQVNKKKRVREQWSIEDKNHFFEAVAVHGKDFEAIHKAIAQKHKKRGDESVVKTKDQVRHLFYRTWTMINKLLDHEASANHNVKGSQELLAVINYGELRKKLGGCILKKKGILKLNELITYGSTSVRVKGKNYRIKTPSCKALKRIHDLEGAAKKSSVIETRRIKLPLRVNLELHPLSMNAWNRVHLLAHNPRLRFNMPLDCQLSSLLAYLAKKWQSLSAKMFGLAHGDSLSTTPNLNLLSIPSTSMVEIHIPPEVSVKSKFQVHEVVSTKTHCVVSYFLHKTGKQLSNAKKKKKDTEIPGVLPTIQHELCNSSEDEGHIEHISDLDEHPVNNLHSVTPTAELKDDDLKAIDTDSDEGTTENSLVFSGLGNEPDADIEKVVDSFYQETEISADPTQSDCTPNIKTGDSNESVASDNFNNNNLLTETDKELKEDMNEQLPICDKNSSIVQSIKDAKSNLINASDMTLSECYVSIESSVTAQEKSDDMEVQTTSAIAESQSPQHLIETPASADTPDLDVESEMQCDSNATIEANSPVKPVPLLPVPKHWDSANAGDITLAEIYLMVGKPSAFKLCYDWKDFEPESRLPAKETSKSTTQKLSTSVTALVQYASLLLSKIQKASNDSNHGSESDKSASDKSISSSGISVGVQCNFVEKADVISKKSQNKAAKRVSESSDDLKEDFAVPNVPLRRKRNQSAIARKSALSNVEGIPQGGQVRLSDVEFRKQMDAINRRIDLFRTKSRNRSARKPYIVQRTMMPNAKSVRKMMTLSVDSMGTNRVGFLPITSQLLNTNAEPELEAVGATIFSASKTNNSTESSWGAGHDKPAANSNSSNVLALAAEKAGLLLNKNTPAAENSSIDTSGTQAPTTASRLAPTTSSQLQTVDFSISSQDDNLLPLDTSRSTSPDSDQSSLIRNDVNLNIRPPTPCVDSMSDLFNFASNSNNFLVDSVSNQNNDRPSDAPVLSMPVLDLPITPQKALASPVHPWSINCNSRDGLSGFTTLNTPQRILLSDTEDSMDGIICNITKRPREGDACVDADPNLQCLLSENSVDFLAKFQNLMPAAINNEADTTCENTEAENKVYEPSADG